MYSVLTRLGDGELLYVASRDSFEQGARLAAELNATWPREYVVRDPIGNDVGLDDYIAIPLEANSESYLA